MKIYSQTNQSYSQTKRSYSQAIASYSQAKRSYSQTIASYSQAKRSYGQTIASYSQTMTSCSQTITSYTETMTCYSQAKGIYIKEIFTCNQYINACRLAIFRHHRKIYPLIKPVNNFHSPALSLISFSPLRNKLNDHPLLRRGRTKEIYCYETIG
jgi:hypothetical protein